MRLEEDVLGGGWVEDNRGDDGVGRGRSQGRGGEEREEEQGREGVVRGRRRTGERGSKEEGGTAGLAGVGRACSGRRPRPGEERARDGGVLRAGMRVRERGSG